jgi:mRNA deadenylase 3'-5' endonuclease subunit Ccr4
MEINCNYWEVLGKTEEEFLQSESKNKQEYHRLSPHLELRKKQIFENMSARIRLSLQVPFQIGFTTGHVSVMQYNVLADDYARPSWMQYVLPKFLSWKFRKWLILGEIIHYKPDILCLQVIESL